MFDNQTEEVTGRVLTGCRLDHVERFSGFLSCPEERGTKITIIVVGVVVGSLIPACFATLIYLIIGPLPERIKR